MSRNVESLVVRKSAGLDTIYVYAATEEGNPHACSITIACYDQAWTAYFGGMGKPWRDFVMQAGADYLANALMRGVRSVARKAAIDHVDVYLQRIVAALKAHLRDEAQANKT